MKEDFLRFDLVVPVFNEAAGLSEFFDRITALKLHMQVIFIDNASTDNSLELLKRFPGAIVIEHEKNEGYGCSIIDGINAGNNENIIIIDADCEYPPECIPDLLQSLNVSPVVYASRFLSQSIYAEADMPWLKKVGNRIVSTAFNHLFKQQVTDLYTGCRGFKRSCLNGLAFQQNGFEYVLELAVKLVAKGYDINEIPVKFRPRITGISKMSHVSETTKFFYLLLRYACLFRTGKL